VDGVELEPFMGGGAASRIEVWVEREGPSLWTRWLVDAPLNDLMLPISDPPSQKDGLWRTTCFELFVAGEGAPYLEINAAPSGDWAAYRFQSPREGMTPLVLDPPTFTLDAGEEWISVEATVTLPPEFASAPLSLNIAAVIETTDGAFSHWALAHPAGQPDFHDRSCFRLNLPAAA